MERSVSTVAEQSEAVQGFYEVCSYIIGWMDRWMNGQTDGWMDGRGWMDGCVGGWMDEWING